MVGGLTIYKKQVVQVDLKNGQDVNMTKLI